MDEQDREELNTLDDVMLEATRAISELVTVFVGLVQQSLETSEWYQKVKDRVHAIRHD